MTAVSIGKAGQRRLSFLLPVIGKGSPARDFVLEIYGASGRVALEKVMVSESEEIRGGPLRIGGRRSAVTLIELIVVIGIIAVLVAVFVLSLRRVKLRATL